MPRAKSAQCWYVAVITEAPDVEAARTRTRGGMALAFSDLPDGQYTLYRECRGERRELSRVQVRSGNIHATPSFILSQQEH
jgi:hypothetical protein